jgi:drug/metabolite transporter (DMT)-like permease
MKPKWLLIIGVILIILGTAWFLRSVGMGGGYGAVLVVLAGFCCVVAGIVLHLIRRHGSEKRENV